MATHDALRARLMARLTELTGRVDRIQADLRKPGDRDWTERAIEIENDDVLDELDDLTLAEVGALRQAIGLIDNGTYGICTRCGGPVGAARLEALPAASLCVQCASSTN